MLFVVLLFALVRAECGAGTPSECASERCCPNGDGASCYWSVANLPQLRRRADQSPMHLLEKRIEGSCQCSVHSCCPVSCVPQAWSAWSACNATCGTGSRTRQRHVEPATCNGECVDGATQQTEPCYVSPCCPVDCAYGVWSAWSGCSAACGTGSMQRSRTRTDASCGGVACSMPASENAVCNTQCCPVACQWSAWGPWGACSATCSTPNGSVTRSRSTAPAASCGGAGCVGHASESAACFATACPVSCQVAPWSTWSACAVTCGSATRTRTRTVTTPAANGGMACPPLSEDDSCQLPCCPQPCSQTGWTGWSACSVSCGDGTRSRGRTTTTAAQCGGACGTTVETENCVSPPCATNCAVNPWSGWSACSQTCGSGQQQRTRTVATPAANGGTACPALTETQTCTSGSACTCLVGVWGAWTACSKACGSGTMSRTRQVLASASDCPPLSETMSCNTQVCAQDCQVSTWGAWAACSAACGGGTHVRQRTVTTAQAGTGVTCPVLSESEACNTMSCSAVVVATTTTTAAMTTTGSTAVTTTTGTGSSPAGALQCSDFRNCDDCADGGKTSPLRCQFCAQDDAPTGVCVPSSTASCPVGFGRRAASIAECAATTAAPATDATAAPLVVVAVDDVAAALGLAANSTAASNATSSSVLVASGVAVQVRAGGAADATLVALGDGGGVGANGGLLRDGLSIELLFDSDRPVSLTRLVLGSWDDGADSARLDVMARRDDAAPAVQLTIDRADSSLDEAALRSGYTKYVLVAGQGAEFSLKSFAFVDRSGAPAPAPTDAASVPTDAPLFGVTEIALIAAGGALLVCIALGAVAFCLIRQRRRQQSADGGAASMSSSTTPLPLGVGSAPHESQSEMHSFADASMRAAPSFRSSEYGAMTGKSMMPSQPSYAPAPHVFEALAMYDDPENVREF